MVPEGPGRQPCRAKVPKEGWAFFRDIFKGQELAVPTCGREPPAWLSRALWRERGEIGVHEPWQKGQATRGDYRDIVRLCREKMRRAKPPLELHLATAIEDN